MTFIEVLGNNFFVLEELKNYLKSYNPSILEKDKLTVSSTDLFISDGKIQCDCKNKILVFCGGKYKSNIIVPKGSICICKGNDKNAISALLNKDITVVTCGMNKNNTVTFSSLNTSYLISLQREITSVNGKTVEPFEFPSIFKGEDTASLLILNALVLVLDKLEKNI